MIILPEGLLRKVGQPLSPTYSIASDFVFPDLVPGGGIGRLGLYNNVFVQGFIAAVSMSCCSSSHLLDAVLLKSQQFTRRFDGLLHKVRQGLRAAGGRSRRAY